VCATLAMPLNRRCSNWSDLDSPVSHAATMPNGASPTPLSVR
jgi:hypothetical protein